ncbi:MAG: transposase [Chloroflexi bacterium]|nr:transposase [Chloroflexota bacterium]
MPYNPDQHHRCSIRLQGWDYTSAGAYFITICVKDHQCVFGRIADGTMHWNAWAYIVMGYWQNLPHRFPNIALDTFVVMPNHVHFILWLNPSETQPHVGAQFHCAPTNCAPTCYHTTSPIGRHFTLDKQRPSLGQVIRSFKAATARLIRKAGNDAFAWQRNYYERVIRDEEELNQMRQYILDNPANWANDKENPDAIG